jgi:hypothetical protein
MFLFVHPPFSIPNDTEPWLHVGYFFLGTWAGTYYVKAERQMLEDVNEIRADKGMPPLVGTSAWGKYRPEST